MNKFTKILVGVILVLAVLLGFVYFVFKKPMTGPTSSEPPSTGSYSWKIVRPAGENYELDVYLEGDNVPDVSAVELDVDFDKSLIKMSKAESGGFFQSPLVIKMDTEGLIFAVAKNPTNQTPVDANQPLFKLFFEPKSGFSQTTLNILPSSQIYIKNTGGNNPAVSQIVLQK